MIDKYIDEQLKNIGEEPLPEGFSDKLHIKLVEAANENKKFNFKPVISVIASAAAVIAIAFGINSFEFNKNDADMEIASLTPKTINQPVATAEFDMVKTAVMYGEYEVNLKGNKKVLKEIEEIAEVKGDVIVCNQQQFDEIFEILLNNDIELTFNYQRENDNLIIIK